MCHATEQQTIQAGTPCVSLHSRYHKVISPRFCVAGECWVPAALLGSRAEPPKPLRLRHRRFYGAMPRKDNRTTSCCIVVSCCSIKRGILSCMEAKQSFLDYIFQSVQFTINQSIYQNVLIRTGQVCTPRKRLHGTCHLFLFFFFFFWHKSFCSLAASSSPYKNSEILACTNTGAYSSIE